MGRLQKRDEGSQYSSFSEFWIGTGKYLVEAVLYAVGVALEVAGKIRAVIVVDGGVLKKIQK